MTATHEQGEFRGHHTQLRRDWSLVDLGQAAYDLGDTPRRARLMVKNCTLRHTAEGRCQPLLRSDIARITPFMRVNETTVGRASRQADTADEAACCSPESGSAYECVVCAEWRTQV